jgi:hypothetical protein
VPCVSKKRTKLLLFPEFLKHGIAGTNCEAMVGVFGIAGIQFSPEDVTIAVNGILSWPA